MGGKARLGKWVLIAVVAVLATGELALAGFSLQAERFKGQQITRVLLTGWLLWRVWDGAGWARWLMAGFCLAGAVLVVAVGLSSPSVRDRPEALAVVAGVGAVGVALGLGLASPWVGAYQAARRGKPYTSGGIGGAGSDGVRLGSTGLPKTDAGRCPQ